MRTAVIMDGTLLRLAPTQQNEVEMSISIVDQITRVPVLVKMCIALPITHIAPVRFHDALYTEHIDLLDGE
jgi:hypothetical protein